MPRAIPTLLNRNRKVRSRAARRIGPPSALILVGFMGAGKTSVGRALAAKLGWTFEDLDARVERRERCTVPQIFRDRGEAAFRRAEHAALQELLHEMHSNPHRIIALGGGAFAPKQNLNLIGAAGVTTVFLDAGSEELWRRCREESAGGRVERPLLHSFESFRDLYAARRSHYLKASLCHSTRGKSVEQVAVEILSALALQPCSQGEKH